METITITVGKKTFVLDKTKAEEAFNNKKVINGRQTMFFNILPLKYQWAYDLYKTMKANHWEPEEIPMQEDCQQWRDTNGNITEIDRWIIKMAIGYFSAAEGIVGDNIIHVVREVVTAPELKLVLGRHAHEENIHADSLVYMISSLGINPHECEAMFEDIPTIAKKAAFVVNNSRALRRKLDLTKLEDKQALAHNIFLFGQCMEGTQFYGLFGMVLSLARQNKFPGIGNMFKYTLRDELRQLMASAVALEKDFIRDCLPINGLGLSSKEFEQYIDYIADRRLRNCGLEPLTTDPVNPFPWLSEMMDLKKEQNFFEGRVTEYQKSANLETVSDDEL
jgi:ribonucleoside-diphosphate reductase beta chain